jgi:hypothetical protein
LEDAGASGDRRLRSSVIGVLICSSFDFRFCCHALPMLIARGCGEKTRPQECSAETSDSPQSVEPYPHGRWRLADRANLNDAMLWLSHVLIRYREAKNFNRCFSFADWNSSSPVPVRTRAEARALAENVARDAESDPTKFGLLARRYSEDGELTPLWSEH